MKTRVECVESSVSEHPVLDALRTRRTQVAREAAAKCRKLDVQIALLEQVQAEEVLSGARETLENL